ncbi:hypothetical protein T484DRAFT_1910752 [Baffinella frigidus]|nr:hypothetical protein T484DRAFT_1910752 [Cryptophyta sp. CCMP2293]
MLKTLTVDSRGIVCNSKQLQASDNWAEWEYTVELCPFLQGGSLHQATYPETLQQFYTRCSAVMDSVAAAHVGERVLLVTHGTVIEACLKALIPGLRVPALAEGSVSEVVWDTRAGKWVLEKLGVVGYEKEEYEHVAIEEFRWKERMDE